MSPRLASVVQLGDVRASALQFRYLWVTDGEGLKLFDVTRMDAPRPVPEATVRGVRSALVSLVGRPTTGGFDYGRLRLFSEGYRTTGGVGATSATTAWVKFPEGYRSWLTSGGERIPPGVRWTFETTGTDSVDIQQYTVTVRYLVIAD